MAGIVLLYGCATPTEAIRADLLQATEVSVDTRLLERCPSEVGDSLDPDKRVTLKDVLIAHSYLVDSYNSCANSHAALADWVCKYVTKKECPVGDVR